MWPLTKSAIAYNNSGRPNLLVFHAGGWLALWQGHANADLAGLRSTPPVGIQARILE
jgi:hypothetical protein